MVKISNLLRDCKKGTELYSPIIGKCLFETIYDTDKILVRDTTEKSTWTFNSDGSYVNFGECLLFPSKDIRDWNFFKVYYVKVSKSTTLGERNKKIDLLKEHGGILDQNQSKDLVSDDNILWYIDALNYKIKQIIGSEYILSTGKEIDISINTNFKKNDVVSFKGGEYSIRTGIILELDNKTAKIFIDSSTQITRELSDLNLATDEQIKNWNNHILQPKNIHYSKNKNKLIYWFSPFDKVSVRNDDKWHIDFFEEYDKTTYGEYPYKCIGGSWKECLPYKEGK